MRRFRRNHGRGQFVWLLPAAFSNVPLVVLPNTGYGENVTALVTGLLIGGFWQLRSRRDLADRLTSVVTTYAVLAAIGLLGLLVGGEMGRNAHATSGLLFWVGVVIGLALTEQLLRRLDREHAADHAAPSERAVPSGDQVVA